MFNYYTVYMYVRLLPLLYFALLSNFQLHSHFSLHSFGIHQITFTNYTLYCFTEKHLLY